MRKTTLGLLFIGSMIVGCEKEDDVTPSSSRDQTTINVNDLTGFSVDENSSNGTVIGTISATVKNSTDSVIYSIESQTPSGAIFLDGNSITIANSSLFDYETNLSITGKINISAGDVSKTVDFAIAVNDIDESNSSTDFLNNTLRQVTGTVQDIEINHMYAQRWENVFVDQGNSEGALKFDIRGPLDEKRMEIYFSGIASTSKTYTSSAGSGNSLVSLKSGEFVVNKIRLGSNENYWWAPNDEHHATLTISGNDVLVEIENFELGGGLGSIGKETFNVKFTFSKSDYDSLADNTLKQISFK